MMLRIRLEALSIIFDLEGEGSPNKKTLYIIIDNNLFFILQHKKLFYKNDNINTQNNLETQKNMVSFIYQHYSEKILLDDIAASGYVSRSKCCIIFKHYLHQSPIDFLNSYRLKVSCNMLKNTKKVLQKLPFLVVLII